MKRTVIIVLGLMFVNLALAGNSAKQSIIESNAKLMKAFGSDAQVIASLYTQDGQLMPTGSDAIKGHAEIAKFWQSVFDAGITAVILETLEVSSMGDTAVEVGKLELKNKNGMILDKGKYVVVWKLVDGQWKLHRDIWTSNTASKETSDQKITHVVMIWLNDELSEEQVSDIIKKTNILSTIDVVQDLEIGRPVSSKKKVVDDSFSFAISMNFENNKSLKQYMVDPVHHDYVKSVLKPVLKKVLIYDFK